MAPEPEVLPVPIGTIPYYCLRIPIRFQKNHHPAVWRSIEPMGTGFESMSVATSGKLQIGLGNLGHFDESGAWKMLLKLAPAGVGICNIIHVPRWLYVLLQFSSRLSSQENSPLQNNQIGKAPRWPELSCVCPTSVPFVSRKRNMTSGRSSFFLRTRWLYLMFNLMNTNFHIHIQYCTKIPRSDFR